MSYFYRGRVVRLVPPKAGVLEDVRPVDVGLSGFVRSKNVVFLDGRLVVRKGLTMLIPPDANGNQITGHPVKIFRFFDRIGDPHLLLITTKRIYEYNGAAPPNAAWNHIPILDRGTQIELSGTLSNRVDCAVWDFGEPDGVGVIIANGVDGLVKWVPSSSNAELLFGTPPCKSICVAGNRVVGGSPRLGTVSNDRAVTFSDPLSAHSGWSEFVVLSDTPGPIVAVRPMGNLAFAVFKTDAIYIAQLTRTGVGGVPFAFSLRVSGIDGPIGRDAICDSGLGGYFYVGLSGGVYLFDGVSVKSLGDNIRRYISKRLNFAVGEMVSASFDNRYNLLYVMFPRVGEMVPRSGVAIDPSSGALWPLDYGDVNVYQQSVCDVPMTVRIAELVDPLSSYNTTTFDSLTLTQPSHVFCGDASALYTESGSTDNGQPIPFLFETGVSDLIDVLAVGEEDPYYAEGSKIMTFCVHQMRYNKDAGDTVMFNISSGSNPGNVNLSVTADVTASNGNVTHTRISNQFYSFGYEGVSFTGVEWHFTDIGFGGHIRR